ncbi:MAG: hypothetical protein KDD01_25975, partial [Phaeodactylibacter sp.]|nr:hypothetical protein [Phaeodactylibacter sp.]
MKKPNGNGREVGWKSSPTTAFFRLLHFAICYFSVNIGRQKATMNKFFFLALALGLWACTEAP